MAVFDVSTGTRNSRTSAAYRRLKKAKAMAKPNPNLQIEYKNKSEG